MALFDGEIAKIYDSWTSHGYYDYEKEAKVISDIIGPRKSIIELGIGTGNTAIPLAKRSYEVFGVDDSKDMLAQLKEKIKKDNLAVDFELQDLRNIQTTKSFDVALSAGGGFYLRRNR